MYMRLQPSVFLVLCVAFTVGCTTVSRAPAVSAPSSSASSVAASGTELSLVSSGSVSLLTHVEGVYGVPSQVAWAAQWNRKGAYVFRRADDAVYVVNSSGALRKIATLLPQENFIKLHQSFRSSDTVFITTYINTVDKKGVASGTSRYVIRQLQAASGAHTVRIEQEFRDSALQGLAFLGELPNGDVVYCACDGSGKETISGTLFVRRVATGKSDVLKKFSVQRIAMLHGTSTLIFTEYDSKKQRVQLSAYDVTTRKQRILWAFPNTGEIGPVLVDTFGKRALAMSNTGVYVVSLLDGNAIFSLGQSAAAQGELASITFPLSPSAGSHFTGIGLIDGGKQWGVVSLHDDGVHAWPLPSQLPRYEPIGYVHSGAVLLGRRIGGG